MKEYVQNYINQIDKKLEGKINKDLIQEHLIKIKFFQHERLIHLIVTVSYAIFLLLSIIISFNIPMFLLITFIFIIFLLFYVKHYFFLENSVQYMYKQYDKMKKKHTA